MSDGGTLLVISGNGVPTFASRGATQTLDPIAASSVLRRTVNGGLIDLSPPQMRKYKSTISCTDINGPAFDGVWPGDTVTVDCIPELAYLTIAGSPERPVVTGSERVVGDYTYYRPQLVMRVIQYTTSTDEYGAAVAWQLDLEED